MQELFPLLTFTVVVWIFCGLSDGVLAQSADETEEVVARPVFRIVAPQVICKRNRNAPEVELPKQITISMQTKGGQVLSYRVQMYFEVLGGFRGQQHSLILWNSVRRLEHKINNINRKIISEKNQINVNNTELTSGVYYIFKIVGIDEAGVESDPQNFTVTFSDGIIKRTNADGSIIPDDISFLLLGAEVTYADVDYIVEADVFFCEPRNDYKIHWNITEIPTTDKVVDFIRNPGSLLRIPAGLLRGGKNHTIVASLLRANDSSVLVSKVSVSVLSRGFSVMLTPSLLTTGIGQSVQVSVEFRDPDNIGWVPEVSWSCYSTNKNEVSSNNTSSTSKCDAFEASSELVQNVEFYIQGEFTMRAIVKIGQNESILNALIIVHKDIIARPIILNVPVRAIPAGERFELEAIVDDLVPNCYCYWESLNETDFEFFDTSEIPGGLGNVTVFDLDGNFLSELVDYGNATLSKDVQLTIPAIGEVSAASYEGLLGDSQYKFRLNAICPAPITDLDDVDAVRPNVTSFVDLVLMTNAAPVGRELEITPNKGNALKTVFKLSTGVALDQSMDYPLKYNFMIRINPFVISLGEYYENAVTTAVLPYSSDPIETLYEVCDSRGACSRVNGPNVSVKKWPMTDREFSIIADRFSASMDRLEYDLAFRMALITAISLKNTNDQPHLVQLQALTEKSIAEQIKRLQAIYGRSPNPNDFYVTTNDVINFVSHARQTISVFGQINDALIHSLIQLLDMVADNHEGSKKRRKRRSVITTVPTTFDKTSKADSMPQPSDEILQKLELSESLLKSSNQEEVRKAKTKIVETVHNAMMKLCRQEKFSPKTYRKSVVKFEIREIPFKQLQRFNHSVPLLKNDHLPNAQVSFNGKLLYLGNRPNTKWCIGKAEYMLDLVGFDDETPNREIFEVVVMTLDDGVPAKNKSMLALRDTTGNREFDVVVPFYNLDEANQLRCQVWDVVKHEWNDSICDTIAVRGLFILCKCSQLGFFRLKKKTTDDFPIIEKPLSTVEADVIPAPTAVVITSDLPISTEPIGSTINTPSSVLNTPKPSTDNVTIHYNDVQSDLTTVGQKTLLPVIEVITLPPATTSSSTTVVSTFTPTTSSTTFVPVDQSVEETAVKDIVTSNADDSSSKKTEELITHKSSSTGYVVAGVLVALGALGVGALYVYHRRKGPNAINQNTDGTNTELREPVGGIKYARFHDEHTLRGNTSIETLFNGHGGY